MFHVKLLGGRVMPQPADESATRRSYDRVAEFYADQIAQELPGKPLDRALLGMIAELAGEGLVADIGCGPGHVAGYLAGCSARTIGIDLSAEMCVIGRRNTSLPFCAASMTQLPMAPSALAAIVCLYAVIHLDPVDRSGAFREFARTLKPGGHALIAFHVSDADVSVGGSRTFSEWWGIEVDLKFRFLDPLDEISRIEEAGLQVIARLDRDAYPAAEHPSRRCYLLAQRPTE
jgi:SAM-dependent methyltransferase